MQSEHLERAIKELATRENEFVSAVRDSPAKQHNYKIKFAVALEMADGSVEAKKAAATKICSKEYLEHLEAEARVEIAKTLLYDVREVLAARRSLLSYEKAEMELAGRDGAA